MTHDSDQAGPAHRPAIRSLTGVRFFAALLVAFSHFPEVIPVKSLAVALERQGAAGVTIFFVLSGFVLTYNYLDEFGRATGTAASFYRNRIARIFPVHLVALVVLTPLVVATAADVPSVASWFVNAALLQSFVPTKSMNLWNIPSWSVSAELAFYAVFPFFIHFVAARTRWQRRLPAVAIGLFVVQVTLFTLTALALDRRLRRSGHDDESVTQVLERVKFFPGLRVWEFLLGCMIGVAFLRRRSGPSRAVLRLGSERVRNAMLLIAIAGLGAIMLIPTLAEPSPGSLAHHMATAGLFVVYTPLAVVLVAALAWGPGAFSPVLESRWAQALGEASYSFYILQWIVFTVVTQTSWGIEPRRWWFSTLAILVLIVMSLASARWIERPANRALRARRVDRLSSPVAS
jgi:peptidoglycan/LPS O-acetylase OafA/YrhL